MVVGVDVSSRRIDLAWLEDGRPCRWHQELAKGHLIDRLRSIDIRWPMRCDSSSYLMEPTSTGYNLSGFEHEPGWETTEIAIEYPFGRGNAIAALMATTGIITRQAPPWSRVAWPSSGELRTAIGAKNTKADAHDKILQRYGLYVREDLQYWPTDLHHWNEHELDALVACIGWTRILEQQDTCTP